MTPENLGAVQGDVKMWCLLNDVGDKTDKNYISVLSCNIYLHTVQLGTACFGAEAVLLGGVRLGKDT